MFLFVMIVLSLNGCKTKEESSQTDVKMDLVPGTKHNIVLLVDTENIKPGSNVKDFCSFPDRHPKVSIEDYTTHVLPGDSVVWLGLSTSAPTEDKVCIEMINHRGGDNVLGPLKDVNCKVAGIIKEDALPDQEESYVIHFKVIKDGSPSKTYILDPKLRVH